MRQYFTDPMTFSSECFTSISSFHPLVLALKHSLRDVTKTANEKLALDCDAIFPAIAQTLLRAREIKEEYFETKHGKYV